LSRGPVVAAFFKISCPICQYAFPFLERIYKAYGKKNVSIIGISQNNKKDTAGFLREFGITFPILLDDTNTYPVSNAYGLTNVPDRKSTRLNSSHGSISYAVFCLKKKSRQRAERPPRARQRRAPTGPAERDPHSAGRKGGECAAARGAPEGDSPKRHLSTARARGA